MKKTISMFCVLLSMVLLLASCKSADPATALYGEWVENEQNCLFIFNKDGSCYFYKDADDRSDNYYVGDEMLILNGQDALDDLGITADEASRIELYKDASKVYSIKLYYTGLFSEGIDKSDKIAEGAYDWYMFTITGDGTAVAVNMHTFSVLELTKIG